VLAQLESVCRTGGGWVPEVPLDGPSGTEPADEPLLELAHEAAVQDVVNLSRSVPGTFGPLIEGGPTCEADQRETPGPRFVTSRDRSGSNRLAGTQIDVS
jgi:hypothetical protein